MRVDPDRIRWLTFDCYGTLIDWERGIVEAFRAEAAKDGLDLDPARVLEAHARLEREAEAGPYRPYRDVLAVVARRAAGEWGWPLAPERARFLADSLATWPPYPDTNPALRRLARRYRLAILSNVDDDLLAATLQHLDVRFDLLVTAERVRSYKPGAAHFREAARRIGGADAVLHVARSLYHDVRPALALGWAVAWVNRGDERMPAEIRGAVLEVPDLAALADRLGA
jgi:2-haloalkanoic acid dehalogenase type II